MKYRYKFLMVVMVLVGTAWMGITELHAQTYYGIRAGANFSNMLVKDNFGVSSDHFKMKPGFHIGVTAEMPFVETNDTFMFETGLLFTTKGFRSTRNFSNSSPGQMAIKTTAYYLEVPLTAKAYYQLEKVKIYGLFGPYLGRGVNRRAMARAIYDNYIVDPEEEINWEQDDEHADHIGGLDLGLIIGGGVQLNAMQIGINYGLGLENVSPHTTGKAKAKNRVLSLSVGYKFGGR